MNDQIEKNISDPFVTCTVCGLSKKPIGRDAAAAMAGSLCDHECPGYRQEPLPSAYWPGERLPAPPTEGEKP